MARVVLLHNHTPEHALPLCEKNISTIPNAQGNMSTRLERNRKHVNAESSVPIQRGLYAIFRCVRRGRRFASDGQAAIPQCAFRVL